MNKKKSQCTFTQMALCYVNGNKEIVTMRNENFLNLEEEEYYKFLEIAKKVFSGKIGNTQLEFEFPQEQETAADGMQRCLLALRESGLKQEEMLRSFYEKIIDTYEYTGNYLILVFHDAYDVMVKTSDNKKTDESEVVYEYLVCAICPVVLSKPGLSFLESENRIGPRQRDWVVNVPETGFVFPAFTDRNQDIHSIMYYTRNPKDTHMDFVQYFFGCNPVLTAAEKQDVFKAIVVNNSEFEDPERTYMKVQGAIQDKLEEINREDSSENPTLKEDALMEILEESNIPEESKEAIVQAYCDEFSNEAPEVQHMLDAKVAQKQKEHEKITSEAIASYIAQEKKLSSEKSDADIIVFVSSEKACSITEKAVDGKNCMVIPVEDGEKTNITRI